MAIPPHLKHHYMQIKNRPKRITHHQDFGRVFNSNIICSNIARRNSKLQSCLDPFCDIPSMSFWKFGTLQGSAWIETAPCISWCTLQNIFCSRLIESWCHHLTPISVPWGWWTASSSIPVDEHQAAVLPNYRWHDQPPGRVPWRNQPHHIHCHDRSKGWVCE